MERPIFIILAVKEGPTDRPGDRATDQREEGPTDRMEEGPTDRPNGGRTDRPNGGRTDRPTDRRILKRKLFVRISKRKIRWDLLLSKKSAGNCYSNGNSNSGYHSHGNSNRNSNSNSDSNSNCRLFPKGSFGSEIPLSRLWAI